MNRITMLFNANTVRSTTRLPCDDRVGGLASRMRTVRTSSCVGITAWAMGVLILSLMLVACQQPVDLPAKPALDSIAPPTEVENAVEPTTPAVVAAEVPEEDQPSPDPAESAYQEGFTDQGRPFKGNPGASVVFEEFSSYQRPFCGKYFLESYPQVVANYVKTGQVLYIFRDFPLSSQPQSLLAAEAAACAGQVGGGRTFWMMHDRIFERQADWSAKGTAVEVFKAYAEELRMDKVGFAECVDSGATTVQVEEDAAEGSARGVRGTPTFFINDQPLVGAQPYAVIAQAIDTALAGESPSATEPDTPATAPAPAAIAASGDMMALGDPGAPVTIVEFSDLECAFCARHFQQTWPRLKAEFVDTGRIRYIFKDFPIAGLHPQAFRAHEAARCAAEQGAFWGMHDQLFAEQANWAGRSDNASIFKRYASELGLDAGAFEDCLASGRWSGAVNADIAEGTSLGVRGTPSFFIDGYPLVGAQPYETFQFAIELAEQGKLGEAFRPQSSAPSPEPTIKLVSASELPADIQQMPPEVQEAYRFALTNPEVLTKIPCYCGCNGIGHSDNWMCYVQSVGDDGEVVFDYHAAG